MLINDTWWHAKFKELTGFDKKDVKLLGIVRSNGNLEIDYYPPGERTISSRVTIPIP